MADHSSIEWTDTTWNPVTGCDRVSPGCAHCYALELAGRLKKMGQAKYQRDGDPKTSGPGFGVTLHEAELNRPRRWRRPRRVFVNSMSDLFHDEVPDEFIFAVFNTMAASGKHIFQVLTKRPERMHALLAGVTRCEHGWLTHNGENPTSYGGTGIVVNEQAGWPIPNVWLGVSIENRRFVDRADLLRDTPAAVRFISAEPLIGPLVHDNHYPNGHTGWRDRPTEWSSAAIPQLDLTQIDWLIVGGESGADHRRIDPRWVRRLRDAATATICPLCAGLGSECAGYADGCPRCGDRRTETAFFFKQWGGAKPTSGGRELDGRTWDEFPTSPNDDSGVEVGAGKEHP